jgi:4-amino-4-deoxy-L-arabinose transferase-like glycosyltransferase
MKIKLLGEKSLTNKQVRFFIIFSICINAIGLLYPILGSNDAYFYSVIAKHIVQSNDWINLTFASQDWLDKPHFPFWITAVSYKIFGINSFAYMLPGFLFNLIGAAYTYLLAKHLFQSKEIGLFACLLYITTLRLMLSSIDVRAEAFLMGEIIPACYYWLLYNDCPDQAPHFIIHRHNHALKYLFLGALFTALAIMTKGIFVLITITSGLIALWVYNKKLANFISKKWLLALGLSLIFILPELISLIIQFDLHPELVVFGQTHVSGIKFFFWDSQFGRFFNTGPITSGTNATYGHYLFFLHTFLWAFLPWILFFIVAVFYAMKSFNVSSEILENKPLKTNYIYLFWSFIPTFILFSLTKFQLDHYTNIILPFAAILCAEWIHNKATRLTRHFIFTIQNYLAILIISLVVLLSILVFDGVELIIMLSISAGVLIMFALLIRNYPLTKAIVFPLIAINVAFVFVMSVNGTIYAKYDVGYQINNYLKNHKELPQDAMLIDYGINAASLEFWNHNPTLHYERISDTQKLLTLPRPFYLVIENSTLQKLKNTQLTPKVLYTMGWVRQEKFMSSLFNSERKRQNMQQVLLVQFN